MSKLKTNLKKPEHIGLCNTCGKRCYRTRKAAKAVSKQQHPSEVLSVYRCGEFFHIGHKSYAVTRGLVERNH
jgi:hypothetical protein